MSFIEEEQFPWKTGLQIFSIYSYLLHVRLLAKSSHRTYHNFATIKEFGLYFRKIWAVYGNGITRENLLKKKKNF